MGTPFFFSFYVFPLKKVDPGLPIHVQNMLPIHFTCKRAGKVESHLLKVNNLPSEQTDFYKMNQVLMTSI